VGPHLSSGKHVPQHPLLAVSVEGPAFLFAEPRLLNVKLPKHAEPPLLNGMHAAAMHHHLTAPMSLGLRRSLPLVCVEPHPSKHQSTSNPQQTLHQSLVVLQATQQA